MVDYCAQSDLYSFGLPRGSVPNPGRLVAAIDTASLSQVRVTLKGNPALTFAEVGATGDTITRASGSWIADGFVVGDIATVSGSVSNNVTGKIAALTATVLTFDTTDLAAEGPVSGVTVVGSPRLTFAEVGATGDTITRSRGSWLAEGFAVGEVVAVAGTALNNVSGAIATLTATVLTFDTTDLVAEEISSYGVSIVSGKVFTLDVHGFALNDPVSFRAEAGGSLPAPLVAGTTFYAIPLTESTFSVAAAPSGAAIDLTSAGSRIVVIAPLPVAAAITWASRIIDDMLPAHLVPLALPVAEIVKMTAAELAAGQLLIGSTSKSLSEKVDAARKRIERWAKGVPIRGDNAPPPANQAVVATVPFSDPRGWNKYGGL